MLNLLGISWLGGGLWIVPLLTFIGAVIFGVLAVKSHNSGSLEKDATGKFVDGKGNVPYTSIGFFWFSVACTVATIMILIAMHGDK